MIRSQESLVLYKSFKLSAALNCSTNVRNCFISKVQFDQGIVNIIKTRHGLIFLRHRYFPNYQDIAKYTSYMREAIKLFKI